MDFLTTPAYADVVALVVGLVLPAVVALFTKKSTSPTVKGIAHAVLAAALGFATVYQADPTDIQWGPAAVAAFLAWLTGTAFYHSLLKKYRWFGVLQDTLIKDAESALHISEDSPALQYLNVFEQAEAEPEPLVEQTLVNDFPLSTDLVKGAAEEVAPEVAKLPVVAEVIHEAETAVLPAHVEAAAPTPAPAPLPTAVLPAQVAPADPAQAVPVQARV